MSCRVYIGRLPYQAREKDVERFFRGFGRIRDVNLKNGFGFVVSHLKLSFLKLFSPLLSGRSLTTTGMRTMQWLSYTEENYLEKGNLTVV